MRKAPFARWLPDVSRGTLAALLLAAPVAASAQGFAGSAVVAHGSATISGSGNVQTVTIAGSSPVTTINWTPTDTATGGGAINFLPAGQTVSYAVAGGEGLYTVLNRIVPSDATRTVAFNGAVNSAANTRVWFYSPGGLLIGSTASFDVGGLVLTTADPVTAIDPATGVPGPFITTTSGTDSFSFAGVAGSTSAITIQPGARISALTSGRSNYIVAIAPQINQGGTISVAGSVALVAAESASFAVDSQGLFNITVSAGTTVADNTFVHTGSTGGPNADPSGSYQRVYMVAVPKNNAISMAIASSGSIGFAVADAANVDGNAIVLSAGSNIADTGSGNPVVAGRAGSGTASLTVGAGLYTSDTYAVSTDHVRVNDPAENITFNSDLAVVAPDAGVDATSGTITVAGDLIVDADNSVSGTTAMVSQYGAAVSTYLGASVLVGTNAAALGVNGDLTVTADDMLTGASSGIAEVEAGFGAIGVKGNVNVSANGEWTTANQNTGGNPTQGGTAKVGAGATGAGELSVGGKLTVSATADAAGANAALVSGQSIDDGANAFGGIAEIIVGGSSSLSAADGITATANASSSFQVNDGVAKGGSANGGFALIEAESGGTIGVGVNGLIRASATASAANLTSQQEFGTGGASTGGTAQVVANAGKITVAGVNGITAIADATGGLSPAYSGSGGSAIGGTALIATQGASSSIATNTSGSTAGSDFSTRVSAVATGADGSGYNAQGGDATGGTATVQATGANQSISFDYGNSVTITADAVAGQGVGTGGGSATGGTAQLLASGGSIALTNTSLTMEADATGGSDDASNGGNAMGGTVRLAASGGGTLNADLATMLAASATGGNGSGNGGNALGGNIFIDLGNNGFNFAGDASSVILDASFTEGGGDAVNGTASSAGGVLVSDLGTINLAGSINLTGNTPFYVQAGGSINVSGLIGESDSGAYVHLLADDLGTGTGTVTLADGVLDLQGSQIDIYYNPTKLGTPTDFSGGIAAGTATAYQLVDDIDQLQLVGSYLSQNFALGKNIDASATQGWNGGAGFVPIGTGASFNGNFDGLNHTITGLYINAPSSDFVGLFGSVGSSGQGTVITIRNIGLSNANITGDNFVGALIGSADDMGTCGCDKITVSNSFSGGNVAANSVVGGLIGYINSINSSFSLSASHSDAAVIAIGSGSSDVGGIVGAAEGAKFSNVFATGNVTVQDSATGVGGLIGENQIYTNSAGSITNAYATGRVQTGINSVDIGGLVGYTGSDDTIVNTYAVGSVMVGAGSGSVGALIGYNVSPISASWASGGVSAHSGTQVGGFVGQNLGIITNSYWDTYSTGQANGVGLNSGTVTQLNPVTSDPAQSNTAKYAFNSFAYLNFPRADWTYDNGSTRPVGAWETPVAQFGVAPIDSAHQVQLIDLNLGGSYLVTQNIDLRGTAGTTDIWGPGGFMPLGGEITDPPFTGTLAGNGHVLSNLTMNPNDNFFGIGLIQQNNGTISDLGLANVNITVSQSNYDVGALAGSNYGTITDSFAIGTITLTQPGTQGTVVGGLVGYNGVLAGNPLGAITQSYASVAITGGDFEGSTAVAGGLVGDNEATISQTFANGAVTGFQTGGLVGESTGTSGPTVTTSYWDTQLTGQSVGCGSIGYSGACGGVTGLTTAQTLQSASFTGFSIDIQGGQELPWRQYEGDTTPLLEKFLTPISIQAGSLTMQYNATTPDVGATTYGAQPSLTFGFALIDGLTPNAGTTELSYAGGLYSNQLGYDFVPSTTPGTLVITPAPLTLTAASDTRVYDSTTNSTGVVQVSGLYGNDNVTSASQSFTSPNVMGTNGSTLVVNPGYVVNDGNGGNNYTVTLQSAPGTITPAALTLAAVSDTRGYNATTGSAGVVQVSGLFGPDNVTNTSQSFISPNVMGTNGSTLVVNPGYVVNDGNGGANYAVTLNGAQGTINPAALAITYTANSASSIYGVPISGLSGQVDAVGLQGADALAAVTTGTASFATVATGQSNVGSYAITGSGLAGNSGNYSFSFVQAPGNATALTIVPRALTLTADPVSRIYGSANPTSDTATAAPATASTGLVNGDSVSSEMVTSPATTGSGVGGYALDGSAALFGSSLSSNYAITYAGNANRLSITPAALTLTYTANPGSSTYGQAPAGLTGSTAITGLVNGDTAAGVATGTALWTSPATATSDIGSYAIDGAGIGLASANYALTSVQAPGNATALTVNPAALSIIYSAGAASRVYGAQNPELSGTETATGLVNGDTLDSVTSGAAEFTTTAGAAANVGSYAVTGAGLAGSSQNYTYDFAQAAGNATALAVTPAAATITYTANPLSSIYGNGPTGLSGTESASGLVNGDTLGSVTSGTASYATTATATSNVGAYGVTGSGLAGSSTNYNFSFAQAPGNANALTIAPRPITVTADPQQRPVGGADPLFTYVVTGPPGTTLALVNGDTLTGQLTSTATVTSPVGAYDILQGTLVASANYRLTYVGNILTLVYATTPIADVTNAIEANLPDQPGIGTPEQRRKQAAADLAALYIGLGLHPPQIAQSMINDRQVTTPPPVNEPVTSNGNSSLWAPGAP